MSAGVRRRNRGSPAMRGDALPEMVDVVFDIAAPDCLPAGYEWALFKAIAALAPWIERSPCSGILPVRGARSADGGLFLARRAKLVVRMPRDRVCAASVLEGATLDLGIAAPRLGQGTFRRFRAAPTLFSPRVAMGESEERAFAARVSAELERLEIARPFLCGRRVEVAFDGEAHTAFSVAVHGLSETQSLRLQAAGLGHGRAVGCGIFLPHKTITASE